MNEFFKMFTEDKYCRYLTQVFEGYSLSRSSNFPGGPIYDDRAWYARM